MLQRLIEQEQGQACVGGVGQQTFQIVGQTGDFTNDFRVLVDEFVLDERSDLGVVVNVTPSGGFTVDRMRLFGDVLPDIQSLTQAVDFGHFVIFDVRGHSALFLVGEIHASAPLGHVFDEVDRVLPVFIRVLSVQGGQSGSLGFVVREVRRHQQKLEVPGDVSVRVAL